MNKGPVFNRIRKYIKSIDKKWRAPKNIKQENTFVFLKTESMEVINYGIEYTEAYKAPSINPNKRKKPVGKQMIKVVYSPESSTYCVSKYIFKYELTRDKGKWKAGYTKTKSFHVKFDKKNVPVVYYSENKAIFNFTYKETNEQLFVENVFLVANNMTTGGITPYINPVSLDLKEANKQRSKYLKFSDLGSLFDYYKVRGKVLRKWILEPGLAVTAKLKTLRALCKVDVNVLQSNFPTLLLTLHGIKEEVLGVFRRFNETKKFKRLMKDLNQQNSRYQFFDLFRLEKQYRRHCGYKFPVVESLNQYHNALYLAIVKETKKDKLVPYKPYPEEEKIKEIGLVNGYEIRIPTCPYDLMLWGDKQAHCIGTYPRKKNMILLSIWKGENLISCMHLEKIQNQIEVDGRRDNVRGYLVSSSDMEWIIYQHQGMNNHPPKLTSEDCQAIESSILNILNEEPAIV